MKKLLSILFRIALLTASTAQAQVFTVKVFQIDEQDTELCGAFPEKNRAKLEELTEVYLQLYGQDHDTKAMAEIEEMKKQMGDPSTFPPAQRKQYEQMEKLYQQMKARTAGKSTSTKLYRELKAEIRRLTVDGKLHNYDEIRDFRHRRAAVAVRRPAKNSNRETVQWWGFVDERMQLVIPCEYRVVHNFNNSSYYKRFWNDSMEDEDNRGWTTVARNNMSEMGMIDRDGKMKIPFKFTLDEHHVHKLVFIQTPWGEFARVYRSQEKKEGIIDRNGEYTLPPTYEFIRWFEDKQCFSTEVNGKQIYFDAWGKTVTPKTSKK